VDTPWWQSLGRIFWWVFTRLWAPFMALAWPALVVYGFLAPRPGDLEALRLAPLEVALLAGVASGGASCSASQPCIEYLAHRTYIVLPRALSNAAASVVEDTPAGPRMTEHRGQGALMFLIWVACLYATWRYWVRPSRSASNYAFERTRER
jgi:hypothetical protein